MYFSLIYLEYRILLPWISVITEYTESSKLIYFTNLNKIWRAHIILLFDLISINFLKIIIFITRVIEIIILHTLDHEFLQVLPPLLALEIILVQSVRSQWFVQHPVHLVLVQVVFYSDSLLFLRLWVLFTNLGISHWVYHGIANFVQLLILKFICVFKGT
jgi:hypothetical protein